MVRLCIEVHIDEHSVAQYIKYPKKKLGEAPEYPATLVRLTYMCRGALKIEA